MHEIRPPAPWGQICGNSIRIYYVVMAKQPWDPGSINLCLQHCFLAMTLDPAHGHGTRAQWWQGSGLLGGSVSARLGLGGRGRVVRRPQHSRQRRPGSPRAHASPAAHPGGGGGDGGLRLISRIGRRVSAWGVRDDAEGSECPRSESSADRGSSRSDEGRQDGGGA